MDWITSMLSKAPVKDGLLILSVILAVWLVTILLRKYVVVKIVDNEQRYRIKKSLGFFAFAFSVVILFVVYAGAFSQLTVVLGIAGAGIAFALQEVIASVAGWLAIIFGSFYSTGDRVQLGGIKGDIIDIGVLRTTIMETGQWVDGDLYNGRIVRVANSFVFKEPVFNYSGDFPFLWDEIKIPIMYGSDYKRAEEIFSSIAFDVIGEFGVVAGSAWKQMVKKYLIEDASTQIMVTLVLNDNWVEFTIRYTVDFKRRRSTRNILFHRILTEVEATNGAVKFASATFHIVEESKISVKNVL